MRLAAAALLSAALAGGPGLARAQKPPAHPVTPPKAMPAPERPTETRYAVQVGAYKSKTDADDLAVRAASIAKVPASVSPVNVKGETLYRIRVFAKSRKEALVLARRLRREGKLPVWVVRLD